MAELTPPDRQRASRLGGLREGTYDVQRGRVFTHWDAVEHEMKPPPGTLCYRTRGSVSRQADADELGHVSTARLCRMPCLVMTLSKSTAEVLNPSLQCKDAFKASNFF